MPGDNFELIAATAHRVADIYADAEALLLGRAASAVRRGLDNADKPHVVREARLTREEPLQRALLNEVTELRTDAKRVAQQLDDFAAKRLPETVEDAAKLGARSTGRDISKLAPGMNISSRGAVNTRAVQALARETYVRSNAVHRNILRNFEDDYRTVVSDIVGRAVVGAETREQAAVTALDAFADRGITGFTDRAGRNWKMSSYVEMATRTATMRALNEGSDAAMKDMNLDFVRISTHARCSDRCAPYQGRILSLSGENVGTVTAESELDGSTVRFKVAAGLERAQERGLFGPNCRHTRSAFVPGVSSNKPPEPVDPQDYKDSQELRRLEREVRKARNKEAVALTPGDKAAAKKKVAEGRKRIAEHVEATGVPRRPDRERLSGKFAVSGDASKAPIPLPVRTLPSREVVDTAVETPTKPAAPAIRTEKEGRQFGRAVWHDYAEALDEPTANDVRSYTGNAFDIINGPLRDGADLTESAIAAARGLDRAIEEAPRIPEAIRVARDVGASVYGLTDSTDITTLIGRSFRDEGFLSTTMQGSLSADALSGVVSVSRGSIELRLDVPEGTKALYVSSHGKNERGLAAYGPEENELIIGRGVGYELYDAIIEDGKRVLLGRITSQKPSKDVL
nr:phage minor capsid protein [Rhodococcus sp. (in: high G+C Gram-positive bacteria)]